MIKITDETVNTFLNGHDPMERIISVECDYMEDMVSIIYVNERGQKMVKKDQFKPFCWAKHSACVRMFKGDRKLLARKLKEYGINVRALITAGADGKTHERVENGYKFLFFSTRKMSYNRFLNFFKEAGTPVYGSKEDRSDQTREFMTASPVEQYLIQTGKRLFKGYENYDELKRFLFDLETQGLNPEVHAIDQIGMRTNKGFERIITITGEGREREINELNAIEEFVRTIAIEKPDIIAGHNSENFDWDFLIVRCKKLGSSFEEITKKYFVHPIYKKKKEAILKLGGEMEYYYPTVAWGFNILDSLHAVRRAQALDSNMKSASLKYTTKYLNLKKPNRVYVPGDKITKTWNIMDEKFAFNNENGDWYEIANENPLKDGYEPTSGRYIVERYLLDDLYETDKVELRLNESNFLVAKILPTTFTRACTMGTAGIWKLIMLAWSYENNLAVPATSNNARFTGGLSRLLKVGFVEHIVKLDFNSLYPSIDLTWNVGTDVDITGIMLHLLEFILSGREKYKELKAVAGKKVDELKEYLENNRKSLSNDEIHKIKDEIAKWKSEKAANDKKQLPLKILANSFFGSYGSPMVFPFGDLLSAEKTTCIGRQSLRIMISHFKKIGYEPIVGDTDGFNFQMPDSFRYTEEHPYISDGGGRNSVKGKAYVGLDADVAEFEDMYFNQPWNGGINKMGLGVDELCDACIQFARKNYADLMPDGSTKKVGNTIKSRKMAGYLEKFIDAAVNSLLHNDGSTFLNSYYDYIEKIYNYQIPIKDIASKGNIKKTIKEYKDDCKTVTKAGSKKSRQAWYELVIKDGINVNVGDSVYYINTGTKKGHSDVKRITHFFYFDDGNKVEITKEVEKLYKENRKTAADAGIDSKKTRLELAKEKYGVSAFDEDEIILNCRAIPSEIMDSEDDLLCSDIDGFEYNSEKYISQFNSRIKPLLVCFSPDIRDSILITDPRNRNYFTEDQAKLVAGYPNKETDQDTYEALMTPEKKEIAFWEKIGEVPPFVKECGIDWDGLVKKYYEDKKAEEDIVFKEENEKYLNALNNLTDADYDALEEEGTIPKKILEICDLSSDMHFYFKKLPEMTPSTGGYIFDDISRDFIEKYDG